MISVLRNVSAALVTTVLIGVLSGCSVNTEQNQVQSKIISSIPDPLPADVSPGGVVLAALLIKTSDITKAVANGLVTPAEVDFALAAIKNDSLQEWVDLAESQK